jgi:hypothetical protein
MITFKEIVSLVKHGHLRNCRFIPGDSANVPIQVDENGIAYFDHPIRQDGGGRILLSEISQEEAERIEAENDYYSIPVWEDLLNEHRKDQEKAMKDIPVAGKVE